MSGQNAPKIKDAAERVRKTFEDMVENVRASRMEGRKTLGAMRPEPMKRIMATKGPLRGFIAERPLFSKLRERRERGKG